MNENDMQDSEKIERWNIAKELSDVDVCLLEKMSEGAVAHYTGGFVDRGCLEYGTILGIEYKIDIVRLREILDIVREEIKNE